MKKILCSFLLFPLFLGAQPVQKQTRPDQIQITFRLAAFEEEMYDALDRKHPGGVPDEAVIRLWEQGAGETLTSQSIVAMNGVNAIVKCVEEIIYPTAMEQKEGETSASYGKFKTREIGAILNVTATLSEDMKMINLVLLPEKAELEGNNELQPEEVEPMTPTFTSINLISSFVLENGKPMVIGTTTDPKSGDRIVAIVAARLLE